ncbi:hydroxyacylglutathione hydrolase [Rhodosalinus halophilus]|uniref:Hydroxyacylglutathione hydrolase n=1 Tax=Rhodosalinus halophilus TaxID=2259333 RepID=A0A365UB67_9RHOB|nr:hydroxyacylglutathione hydrolase [Rhodosalinus halophilus]RBI85698.1 hydroxyacylglutathione hydrolase [Rhodosalinus halophilus]
MPLEIVTVPCLSDNYAYLAHDAETGTTAVVDVPEAAPILAALEGRGWRADIVLLTHHHADHVQGLGALSERFSPRVVGAAADAHRLPPLDVEVREGDTVEIGAERGTVIEVPGHTLGHIAFHFPDSRAAFTADSLMAFGCGRVFEGTMPQMWESLSKLAALPSDTLIYSGHEYTLANGKFARSVEPGNASLISRIEESERARAEGRPTVPSELALELETNPFLRPDSPEIRKAVGLPDASPAEVFAAVRARKDNF